MDQAIANMNDHYIVCGYGRMGKQIVRDLRRSDLPVVVVEWNPEQIPFLVEHAVPYIEGKATDDEVLLRAGVDKARGLIAVAATEEENVFIVLTARGLNQSLYIVARSIREENEDKLRRAGADRVMSPYILGGRRMAATVTKPRTVDFLDLLMHDDSADLEISDLTLQSGCPFVDKCLRESQIQQEYRVNVLAIRRGETELHLATDPDFRLRAGDEVILLGHPSDIDRIEQIVCPAP